jgi:aminopeptidase N
MLGFMVALALLGSADTQPPADPGPGVSETLARERAAAIRSLTYELSFTIPADRQAPVRGRSIARFSLEKPQRVVFDFAQASDRLTAVRAGGRVVTASIRDGHIVVPAEVTRAGANEIEFEFIAGDDALNRNDEFLYTLFVPARARLTFPCFDQPDLKARYRLTLVTPDGWQAVANGAEAARTPSSGTVTTTFRETSPLPTYLFAFVAGKFSVETAQRDGRTLRLFHRETDAAKVSRNREALFDLHAKALGWLEDYTDVRYPWGKFDFVLIPSFQFGGMEHAGAILYNAASLMLDESATQNQLLERASVIAHETAHMWFGDLVTMRWFNDVWMKEVFANFMAAKIVNPSFPQVNHELRFLLAHYPSAYQVDRTAGTNAIRQELGNLDEAGQMYGPIIYQKAPIVMRQLELIVGERQFRNGLREYLKRYSYGNATWLDLVRIIDDRTRENIAEWSRAWVEDRGRPEFTTAVRLDDKGRLESIVVRQQDPMNRGLLWPQRLRVTLGYDGSLRDLPVYVSGTETVVKDAKGLPAPRFVLLAGGGLGYGLFVLDEGSRDYLLQHIEEIPDALTRGAAWVTLWDNLQASRVGAAQLLDAAVRALPREDDEQNAQRVLSYVTRVFWRFMPREERNARVTALEAVLRAGLDRGRTQSEKAAWFNAYRDIVQTPEGVAWLTRVWKREQPIPGLRLAEPDEIAMAMELAVREAPGWDDILKTQIERTQNPDRKARLSFVAPALSADPAVRERAFARFQFVENRRREPWVLESLQYLNHPLREEHAQRFVRPALDLLREIQQTGDIFFPTRWMDSTLAGHRSPEAAKTVREFLTSHPQYPQRLTWTILTSADELFRVSGS